jgi:hypothetical protein
MAARCIIAALTRVTRAAGGGWFVRFARLAALLSAAFLASMACVSTNKSL